MITLATQAAHSFNSSQQTHHAPTNPPPPRSPPRLPLPPNTNPRLHHKKRHILALAQELLHALLAAINANDALGQLACIGQDLAHTPRITALLRSSFAKLCSFDADPATSVLILS